MKADKKWIEFYVMTNEPATEEEFPDEANLNSNLSR